MGFYTELDGHLFIEVKEVFWDHVWLLSPNHLTPLVNGQCSVIASVWK